MTRVGSLEKVLAFPGVVQADTYLVEGEMIRPVRLDGDRRGYVIAIADTNLEALDRAEAAARLIDVEVEPDVSCDFSLDHYRELLEAAKAGGYRFAGFDRPPEPGDLILRHDVDLSLEAAVALAEVEAEAGAWSTWFLMTRSVFYNLDSAEGERDDRTAAGARRADRAPRRLAATSTSTTASSRVVAWHNPDPEYMTAPIEGAVNVMTAPWFDPEHYRSDSNQHWRHGCPHDAARRAASSSGCSSSRTRRSGPTTARRWARRCASFLDADRAARLEHLRADRIDLE